MSMPTAPELVDAMPASTLYHVFLAAAEADRVWGEQEKRPAGARHERHRSGRP